MTTRPHEVLGIDDNASEAQIKARYRTLAKQYHPDMNNGDRTAEWVFKEINKAYRTLTTEREATPSTSAPAKRSQAPKTAKSPRDDRAQHEQSNHNASRERSRDPSNTSKPRWQAWKEAENARPSQNQDWWHGNRPNRRATGKGKTARRNNERKWWSTTVISGTATGVITALSGTTSLQVILVAAIIGGAAFAWLWHWRIGQRPRD